MNNQDKEVTLIKDLQPITHLIVLEDENSRRTIVLEEANYSLGRDPRNSIVLSSKKVSRFHTTLLRRSNAHNKTFSYWILDGDLQGNRSTNGIFVNGKRCLVQELKNEDVVQIGPEIRAIYYIVSNLSDLMLLKSGDFQGQQNSTSEGSTTVYREKINKQTLVFSEPNLQEQEEQEEQDKTELVKLASFPELSPNPIVEMDWEGNITYLNPAANQKFKNLLQKKSEHPILLGLIENTKNHGLNNNLFVREVKIGKQIFEQYIHYLASKKLIRSYLFDFTKRKQLEVQVKDSEQRYKAILNQSKEGIFLADASSKKIIEANNTFCDLLGYTLEEIRSLTWSELIEPQSNLLEEDIENALRRTGKFNLTKPLKYKRKYGLSVELDTNITSIKYGDQKILCFNLRPLQHNFVKETIIQEEQVLYDLVTGLPNRNVFIEQLTTAIANSRRNQGLLCLIFLELDRLQEANFSLNYEVQSKLLAGFGKRLRSCLRAGDTVAHWQDNQFVAVLPQVRSARDAGKVSLRILDALESPFFLDRHKIYAKTNLGISIYGQDGDNIQVLLENAQNALVKSKQKSGNNYQFYNQKIQEETERLLHLEKLLRHALAKKEFLLHYQPQYNVQTKKITAIEALLRWQHPELGLICPDQFMALAEETSLIVPIGEWVLETACRQNKIWHEQGLLSVPVNVNLCVQEFYQPNLINFIGNVLKQVGLPAELLELEITEKIIMSNTDLATKHLEQLHNLGIRIALDDFGSAISGIGFLKQFQFNTLKIDRSVVKNLEPNSQDLAIVSALIGIASNHSFNFRVVAEGVETNFQWELLSSLGCQEIQGSLFTEPLAADDMSQFLTNVKL